MGYEIYNIPVTGYKIIKQVNAPHPSVVALYEMGDWNGGVFPLLPVESGAGSHGLHVVNVAGNIDTPIILPAGHNLVFIIHGLCEAPWDSLTLQLLFVLQGQSGQAILPHGA